MTLHFGMTPSGPTRRTGLSLVETAISVVIVGGMLTAALNAAGAARVGTQLSGYHARGATLAQDLMAEILVQAYQDPDAASGNLGLDASDSDLGNRSTFDDVDDYSGWTASPPQDKDGTVMSDLTGWKRNVTVVYANPSDIMQSVVTGTGIKRIVVTVTRKDMQIAQWTAIRTAAHDTLSE